MKTLPAIALLVFAYAAARVAGGDAPPLKDMQLDTVLAADGASRCRIVAPSQASLQAEARRVQAALRVACGVECPLVNAASVTETDCRAFHHVLLGSLENNGVIAKLYDAHLCFTDALYPGPGGHEVRTLHNPLGWGRNCVLLGGSDDRGVRAAVDVFLARLKAPDVLTTNRGAITLHRLLSVAAPTLPWPVPDEAFVTARVKAIVQGLEGGMVRPQMGGNNGVLDAGLRHFLTGDEGWGRIFRAAMLRYYELADPKDDWALLALSNDPGGQYFWPWKLAIVWDNIEESPIFSDDDRRKITRLLLNLTRWVASCDHFDLEQSRGALYGAPGDLRQGHSTYAALSMFFCDEYFRHNYPDLAEFAPRRADVARIFAGQAASYKSNDNATIYSTLAPAHYLAYRLTRGEFDPRDDRNLRTLADSAIITTDNRADACTYGDGANFLVGYPGGLGFLAKAAWRFDDPGVRWAFDWLHTRSDGSRTGDLWCEGIYATHGARAEPLRLCGIAPVMVDEGLHEFIGRNRRARPAVPPPPAQCFDKLSFRRNFNAQDEYLLLSGLSGVLVHGDDDGNSVLRLTWHDRVWLANLGYRAIDANEHNGLMVRRADRYESPPVYTALEVRSELPSAGFTRTTVRNYNGVDWHRNIFWRKGESFVFLDEVEARAPGPAQLQLVWRTLGEVSLAGDDLRAEQSGEMFNIKSADDSQKLLGQKLPDRNADWSLYPHADGTVKILAEQCEVPSGARHVFVNLLFPGNPAALSVERLGEHTLRLRDAGRAKAILGLAAPRSELDGFHLEAASYQIESGKLAIFDARRVSLAGLELQCDAPVSLELDWRTGDGTLTAGAETNLTLDAAGVRLDGREVVTSAASTPPGFMLPAGSHSIHVGGLNPARLDEAFLASFPTALRAPTPGTTPAPSLDPVWRFDAGAPIAAIATGDLDHDGSPEMVVAAGRTIHAFGANGAEKWSYRAPAVVTCLQLADLDRNGELEVAIGAGSTLYRIGSDGSEMWRRDCLHFKTPLSALTVVDLDGDGRLELLAGNEYSALFAVDASGASLWHSYQDIGRAGITALLAGDFDGDGRAEILVGTSRDHGAVVLDHRGEKVRWKLPGTHHVARASPHALMVGGPQRRGPARIVDPATGRTRQLMPIDDDVVAIEVADVLGEGTPQFVTAFATSGLRVYDESGRERARLKIDALASTLAIADFSGTGHPQIAVGAQDGRVFVLDAQGVVQATGRLPAGIVVLAAFPGGHGADLLAGARDGTVGRFQLKH